MKDPRQWLLACRQIYAEGRAVVDKGFCVQVCDAMDLSYLISEKVLSDDWKVCKIRCLYMCRSVEVVYSNPGRFHFETAFVRWHDSIPEDSAPRKPTEFLSMGREMKSLLPSLKEIQVELFLICRISSQLNWHNGMTMSRSTMSPEELKYDGP
ncbi:hypothetical protein N7454_000864 [Penicillium verhagenii]|nr:hypothetical protein N7454_000864 [Penicillium verhagenii]